MAAFLTDSQFKGQLENILVNYKNNRWHMWEGEADIGNDGHLETLLRVEEGRCGEESTTRRPPRWGISLMVVDPSGTKMDTAKSEWILGVTVRSHNKPLPKNIREIPGLHSLNLSSLDAFNYSGKPFFDRWLDEWEDPDSFLADQRYAELSVYEIENGETQSICRFKLKKGAH